ncbi:MAG: hypothetical protein AAGA96_15530 [Verrucomicrobiota bacterium]
MTKHLPTLAVLSLIFFFSTPQASAGGSGYGYSRGSSHCAVSKFQTPRYNQSLPYRHHEDWRRYNAAPCAGEIRYAQPYLIKTVVVRKERRPHYYYDSSGRRHCRKVLTITYKDVYSDGSCRVWYETA